MPSLEVLATPGAGENRVGPFRDGLLRVRVTRPAADGEANEAVRRLLARALRIPPSRLRLVAGQRARRKRFAADGISEAELQARLIALAGPTD